MPEAVQGDHTMARIRQFLFILFTCAGLQAPNLLQAAEVSAEAAVDGYISRLLDST